ncbi:MAG: helix-turn-helix transcriptional regulator [Clostridia bacterium]|nr:helix-turn-helix transcriptional regulator [Clostridia bacterium]
MKMSLGAFIAHLRKEKGLTQKQLSEILNVSDKTVSHWEREESSPDISLLPLLADTFSITVDELLRGEKAVAKSDDYNNNATVTAETKAEDDFHKFKINNIIAAAVSGSVFLCGICTFIFLGIWIIAFVLLVSGVSSIYAWTIYNNYIYKNKGNASLCKKALRVSSIVFYCNFSFIFIAITSLFINVIGGFIFLSFTVAPLLCLGTELLLRKKGILPKDPKWPEPRRNRLKLKLACTALAFILLWGSLIANQEYHPYNTIYKHAEYVELANRKAFNEYIETAVPAPKEKYEDKYQSPYDIEFYEETENGTERCNTFYRNEEGLEYMLIFNYSNKEVLKIRTTDGNGFPVRCYTHSALIEAEKKAEPEIKAVKICLFALFPVSIAAAFCVYFAIKKKKGL